MCWYGYSTRSSTRSTGTATFRPRTTSASTSFVEAAHAARGRLAETDMSSLTDKLQQVFEEPACGKNQRKADRERKNGCSKQLSPGAAAGGCAFDGAKIALQPITDVAHLVHGPINCEGHSWDGRGSKSSGLFLYRTSFTTAMTEQDIIFGGEKHLYKAIKEVVKNYDPPAVFVYQTCVPAMIGDDIEAVCKAAAMKLGKPVIPVNVP